MKTISKSRREQAPPFRRPWLDTVRLRVKTVKRSQRYASVKFTSGVRECPVEHEQWSTVAHERAELAMLHKNWECAYYNQANIRLFAGYCICTYWGNRYAFVWVVMINPVELAINDEAQMCLGMRWCVFFKHRCAVVFAHTPGWHIKKQNRKLVMHKNLSWIKQVEMGVLIFDSENQ